MQQQLAVPDLCAHLDRLRVLCDQLEGAQQEPRRYQALVAAITAEVEALRSTVCTISNADES